MNTNLHISYLANSVFIYGFIVKSESHSVVSDSTKPPGQNTKVGSLSLLQGIFLTQELNWGLLHCRWILYHLSYQGSPCGFINKVQFHVLTQRQFILPVDIWQHFTVLSHVRLFVTPWTVAHQAPLPVGFSRQEEYRSELPLPPPGDLPNPGIELPSPALASRFFTPSATWGAHIWHYLETLGSPLRVWGSRWRWHWHLVCRGQSCCKTPYNAQDRPHDRESSKVPLRNWL